MANKTIHELTPASTVDSNYEIAVYDIDGNGTKKATADQILKTSSLLYAYDDDEPTGEVDFTSQDTTLTPSSSTSVDLLSGNDSWSQRFVKISQMFKNVRFLLSKLGTTDISSIGNGTVTGALSTLNGNLTYASIRGTDVLTLSSAFASATTSDFVINRIGRIAHVTGIMGALSIQAGRNVIGTLGNGWRPHVFDVFTLGTIGPGGNVGTIVRVEINSNGVLTVVSDVAIASSLRFGCSYTLAV